jgi:methionine-rich copper-binding protein CopC
MLGTCICRSRGTGGGTSDSGRTSSGQDLVHREVRTRLEQDPVFDTSGLELDKRDVKIDQSNAALLTVSLPELKPGKYKVVWHVVSVDTHVTTGDFAFEVTR